MMITDVKNCRIYVDFEEFGMIFENHVVNFVNEYTLNYIYRQKDRKYVIDCVDEIEVDTLFDTIDKKMTEYEKAVEEIENM